MDHNQKHLVNNQIRANYIVLLDENGKQANQKISFADAIELANNENKDLMQVGEDRGVAFCKILKYDSWLYHEKKKKDKQEFKNRQHELKIIQIRPSIGEHDFQMKMKQTISFLQDEHKVKFVIRFKNFRESTMRDINNEFINKIQKELSEVGTLDSSISQSGKEINFSIKPIRKPAQTIATTIAHQKPKM